jgi:hypothetical protein
MMEDIGKHIDTLFEKAVEYGKTSLELAKLKAIDRVSDIAASFILKILISVFLFFVILFASLGLAFWLGEVLGKVYFGFLAVAGIYGILALFMHLFLGKWIKNLIGNSLIKNVLH